MYCTTGVGTMYVLHNRMLVLCMFHTTGCVFNVCIEQQDVGTMHVLHDRM